MEQEPAGQRERWVWWISARTATPCSRRPTRSTSGLRTPAEQAALIAGFAGLLHALTAGIQILIRAVPLDVAEDADQLLAAAEHLPHPALAAAARDHAGFLHELAAGHELLRRQVIVILREPVGCQKSGLGR